MIEQEIQELDLSQSRIPLREFSQLELVDVLNNCHQANAIIRLAQPPCFPPRYRY